MKLLLVFGCHLEFWVEGITSEGWLLDCCKSLPSKTWV